MSQLDNDQRKNVQTIIRVGKRMGANRKQIKSAIQAAIVESGIRNLSGGDRDSVGIFQIREGIHGPVGRTVRGSAKWYFKNAKSADKGQPSHVLAQDVERSGFPERYGQHRGEVRSILKKYYNGGGGGSQTGGAKPPAPAISAGGGEIRKQLLAKYLQERHNPNALLELGKGLKESQEAPSAPNMAVRKKPRSTVSGTPSNWVHPGGGQAGTVGIIRPLSKLAKSMGLGVSGERSPAHNAAVGGASDSDHLSTNKRATARDVSGDPAAMDRYAKKVAKRLGFKTHKGLQTKVKNGYRYQLIWQAAGHYDHVHVSARKV